MKVTVGTGFFTERDVDIDSGHLAKIRYKNDLLTENVFIQEGVDDEHSEA
jgi:hypothetical protein